MGVLEDARLIGALVGTLEMLERRDVITTDPAQAEKCCGIERDDDGFCWNKPGHPIYVGFRD